MIERLVRLVLGRTDGAERRKRAAPKTSPDGQGAQTTSHNEMGPLKADKIVVFATQRCGSTMVVEDMRNTGVLGVPEEYFIPWDPARTDVNWQQAWQSIVQRGSSPNAVMAIKIMANQIEKVDACFRTFAPAEPDQTAEPFPHLMSRLRPAVFVYIKREDIVLQAISRVMARQTGVNHGVPSENDEHFAGNLQRGNLAKYNTKASYDFKRIKRNVINILFENMFLEKFFTDHRIEPIRFVYETVSRDEEYHHTLVLAQTLGVDLVKTKQRKMVKLGNAVNDEWRQRFYDDLGHDIL